MRKALLVGIPLFASILSPNASAQEHKMIDHSMHMQHMAQMEADDRQAVDFPAPMRAHILSNMRDHLKAVSEIIAAMGANRYELAANIADSRLGVNASSATGCKPAGAKANEMMSMADGMETRMAKVMPEGMRAYGQAMHTAASAFAAAATLSAKSGDGKPALVALAKVTDQCVACHAAFKAK
jgi:hypothetical protein